MDYRDIVEAEHMFVVRLDDPVTLAVIADAFLSANEEGKPIRVAIDLADKAFKIKIGNGSWSPPFGEWEDS